MKLKLLRDGKFTSTLMLINPLKLMFSSRNPNRVPSLQVTPVQKPVVFGSSSQMLMDTFQLSKAGLCERELLNLMRISASGLVLEEVLQHQTRNKISKSRSTLRAMGEGRSCKQKCIWKGK